MFRYGKGAARGCDAVGGPGDGGRGRAGVGRNVPVYEIHRAGGVVEVAERQPLLLLVSDDAQRGVRRFETVQEDRLAGFVRVVVGCFCRRWLPRPCPSGTGS